MAKLSIRRKNLYKVVNGYPFEMTTVTCTVPLLPPLAYFDSYRLGKPSNSTPPPRSLLHINQHFFRSVSRAELGLAHLDRMPTSKAPSIFMLRHSKVHVRLGVGRASDKYHPLGLYRED